MGEGLKWLEWNKEATWTSCSGTDQLDWLRWDSGQVNIITENSETNKLNQEQTESGQERQTNIQTGELIH